MDLQTPLRSAWHSSSQFSLNLGFPNFLHLNKTSNCHVAECAKANSVHSDAAEVFASITLRENQTTFLNADLLDTSSWLFKFLGNMNKNCSWLPTTDSVIENLLKWLSCVCRRHQQCTNQKIQTSETKQ